MQEQQLPTLCYLCSYMSVLLWHVQATGCAYFISQESLLGKRSTWLMCLIMPALHVMSAVMEAAYHAIRPTARCIAY